MPIYNYKYKHDIIVQRLDVGKSITLIVLDAPSPRNPREYPHIPYFSRN